jgi:DNA-binding MarR family transcriptional regulator
MNKQRMVGFAVKAVSNEIMRYIDNVSRSSKITGMQHGILHFISDSCEDVFQRDVEKEFNIRRSTATGILQLMEKNGLIRREEVCHDARLKKLIVTDKALPLLEGIICEIENVEKALTKGITTEELDTFFKVLEKISKNIS